MKQPTTGEPCTCKPGKQRDNCPNCEGTGWIIDFKKIREEVAAKMRERIAAGVAIDPQKPFAVYGRLTLNVGDLTEPFTRHSEHATMESAREACAKLEERHVSLWCFAGENVGPMCPYKSK